MRPGLGEAVPEGLGHEGRRWRLDAPPFSTCGPNPALGDLVAGADLPTGPALPPMGPAARAPQAVRAGGLVSGGKNDPLYMLHPYHTKVPHQAIAQLIERHTQPGQVVLDPFCGSGMTGVAARLTGRRAILVDLSPAATFIAAGYLNPLPPETLRQAGRAWLEAARPELARLYRTPDDEPGQWTELEYTVWSDRFRCPHCRTAFLFWDVAVGGGPGERRVRRTVRCPGCGRALTKQALERVWGPDGLAVQEPVERCLPGRPQRLRPVTAADRAWLAALAETPPADWYPTDPLPEGLSANQPQRSHGLTRIDQFYTPRNLRALARLWAALNDFPDRLARGLAFHWTAVARNASRMNRWPRRRGPLSGTLYLPSLAYEIHVGRALARHLRKGMAASAFLHQQAPGDPQEALRIGTQSATRLAGVPDASVDYVFTDPPFGDNLMYSELNLLWEAWLGVRTDPSQEAVVDPVGGRDLERYQALMTAAFQEAARVLKPGRAMTVVFHHARAEVWQAVQEALRAARLDLEEVQALDKRQGSFKQLTSAGAVRYDLVLTFRKGASPARARKPASLPEPSRFSAGSARANSPLAPAGPDPEGWARAFLARLRDHQEKGDHPQAPAGELDPAWLYTQYVAARIREGLPVELDAARFYQVVREARGAAAPEEGPDEARKRALPRPARPTPFPPERDGSQHS